MAYGGPPLFSEDVSVDQAFVTMSVFDRSESFCVCFGPRSTGGVVRMEVLPISSSL